MYAAAEYVFSGAAAAMRHGAAPAAVGAALGRHTDLSSAACDVLVAELPKVRQRGSRGGKAPARASIHPYPAPHAPPAHPSPSPPHPPTLTPPPQVAASPVASHASTSASAAVSPPPRLPQLLGLDWVLGAPVASSSAAAAVGRPFANIQLRVRRPDGTVGTEAVEMTLPQVKAFETAMREAAAALERA
jgi:hypothetical protein